MSQRDRARQQISEKFEFRTTTSQTPEQVRDSIDQIAPLCANKLRGRIDIASRRSLDSGGNQTSLLVKGPGGVMQIMDFHVTATPAGEAGTLVDLTVGSFLFQKGSFGMKPSINGAPTIGKFVTLLKSTL